MFEKGKVCMRKSLSELACSCSVFRCFLTYVSLNTFLWSSQLPATQILRCFSLPDPAPKRHLQSWQRWVLAMQTFSHKLIANTPQHTIRTTRSRTPVTPLPKTTLQLPDTHLGMPGPAATSSPHSDLWLFLNLSPKERKNSCSSAESYHQQSW